MINYRVGKGVRTKKVAWLIPGLIPLGRLTILDGDPGQGKSFISLEIAAAYSSGMEITPRAVSRREPRFRSWS